MTADKMTGLLSRPWAKMAATCAAAIALCLIILTWVLHLTHAELGIPFQDGWDVLLHSMLVKSMVDNGWVWHNPYLGAPFGTQLLDFPFWDNLDLALMKAIAMFTSNYAIVVNLFFLLTFPLTVLCSMLALRSFNISYPTAIVVSLLYAFVPYHFYRGEAHSFVGSYFLLPLMTMVILWVWAGDLTRRQKVTAMVVCALVGSALSYYAFFGCYFLSVAAVVSAIRFKRPRKLVWGIGLIAIVFGALIINTSPTWLCAMRHGRNFQVAVRGPGESEIWGLKLTYLLLPLSDHRLGILRNIKETYDRDREYNEGYMATLGTTGDVGFIFLLGWLFCAHEERNDQWLSALAVLSVSAVLLGTLGGFGTIFNYLVSAQFRCYNRISIYIAFFSLFAVAVLLDALRLRMDDRTFGPWLWRGLVAAVLCLGILDQTKPSFAPDYASRKSDYQDEQDFVDQIENSVPSGAMIFQLPNVHFPEGRLIPGMHQYDELRGYLHSRSLRWSSGAMRGRPDALWEAHHGLDIGELPPDLRRDDVRTKQQQFPPEALNTLVFAGFSGIYIDRNGFWDKAAMITSQFQTLLGEQPLLSKDRRLEFFNLTSFAASLRAKYTAEQWEAEQRTALALTQQ